MQLRFLTNHEPARERPAAELVRDGVPVGPVEKHGLCGSWLAEDRRRRQLDTECDAIEE